MECYCYLQHVQDFVADGQTLYERWFNSPFEGPIISFGAEVKLYPISSKDLDRVQQLGRSWIGPPCAVHVKKIQKKGSKEEDLRQRDDEFVFPCRTGEILQE